MLDLVLGLIVEGFLCLLFWTGEVVLWILSLGRRRPVGNPTKNSERLALSICVGGAVWLAVAAVGVTLLLM